LSLKVLIADDNLIMRNLVKYYLSKHAIDNVLEAKDGVEALQIIKANEIDVLFLDLRMPNLDGFNVANYLNSGDKKVTIIAFSADMTKENEKILKSLDVKYFLKKPIEPKLCNDIIKKILKENNQV